MAVYKFLGTQIAIGTANTVSNKPLARVYCSSSGVLTLAYANATVYANVTLATGESIIVEKGPTDTLTGANMVAVPIAYRN
jgi:hypothetical protein